MDKADVDEGFVEVRYLLRQSASDARMARAQLLALTDAGVTQRDAAARVGVPFGTLTSWLRVARQERDGLR
ncbi:helix-turn-helix domain-containing protein [Curtobacterium flaccumfaciens]|uniref:Helix-turn-helix domain-containing protein n=1 Tax=Curtobacterium poinsettiae TaxID=159612 RepID=A0A9Q9PAC2_9MICO|nr:helix-turn-helix domain-containing protein [Curtobacterium flaccumfaciens]UXN26573.1 helix-turn-helix domain-containing protein [Curtobacterium flaccumfaciens]UYC81415.1 helix-turn-helix domain-containing protein [Curtobacterium flaccumfaciens pv. poinsettiae]